MGPGVVKPGTSSEPHLAFETMDHFAFEAHSRDRAGGLQGTVFP